MAYQEDIDDAPVAAPTIVANLRSVTVCISSRAAFDDDGTLGITDAAPEVAADSARATMGSKVLNMSASLGGEQVLEDLEKSCLAALPSYTSEVDKHLAAALPEWVASRRRSKSPSEAHMAIRLLLAGRACLAASQHMSARAQ